MINSSSPIRGGGEWWWRNVSQCRLPGDPGQPSPAAPHHQHLVIFSANFMPTHWKPQIGHQRSMRFSSKIVSTSDFLSLHANMHPFCHFQNRNHLNLFTIINRPSPQTNLLDTQHGRLCARWRVCVYCLHRPGDSAAAGQSAAAAVDIIVLTFVTLRLGMLSWQTPGLSSAGHQPSVTGDPAHLKTSNTSASCATSWPGSDPSTLIKLQSEIFGCHKRKIDYLCLN